MGRRKRLFLGKYQISDRPAQQESPGIEVKLGWDISSNESVTVKAFDLAKFDADISSNQEGGGVRELIRFEMNTLWRLDHPNVVRLVDVFKSPSKTFVVVEAVSGGGDLFEAIADKGRLEDDSARYYFAQLLDAVEHCHARGVCHRDIKPENVLLDARGNVKLTGFALAGLFDPSLGDHHVENLLHATCGTPDYTAPEVIQGFAYEGAAADVWSLGVTLYAMLAGYLPFEAENLPAVFDKAQAGDFKAAPGMSVEARSLLDCMLEPNVESRYTMQEVRAHPWLAGGTQSRRQEEGHRHNHQHQHHHHQRQEEGSLRRNERSPRLAGGFAELAPERHGASKVKHGEGNDGVGTQGWSLDSFVRRQQRRQQQQQQQQQRQEGAEIGLTNERDGYEQQHGAPGHKREGARTAESAKLGGQWVSANSSSSSSSSSSSFRREEDIPFHDCPSPSEGEEETGEGDAVGRRTGSSYADEFGAGSSVPVPAAGGSFGSITSGPVASAAAPCSSRPVRAPKATPGTISVARRLGATRLVLSLRLLNSDGTVATETGSGPDPGDDDAEADSLIPAQTLQRALESLGCACRLPQPTEKRPDAQKAAAGTPCQPRVRVKACRAVVGDAARGRREREAEEDEEDSIVGVVFSAMLPAQAPEPRGVEPALEGGGSVDGRRSSGGRAAGKSTTTGSAAAATATATDSGAKKKHLSDTTEFLAVLSTGTVDAFNALIDDLLAVPALLSPSCLGSALAFSMHGEERRRERRQTRCSRRGRKVDVGGGGVGGRKSASGVEKGYQAAAAFATTTAAAGN